jgi:hypothetical protein
MIAAESVRSLTPLQQTFGWTLATANECNARSIDRSRVCFRHSQIVKYGPCNTCLKAAASRNGSRTND